MSSGLQTLRLLLCSHDFRPSFLSPGIQLGSFVLLNTELIPLSRHSYFFSQIFCFFFSTPVLSPSFYFHIFLLYYWFLYFFSYVFSHNFPLPRCLFLFLGPFLPFFLFFSSIRLLFFYLILLPLQYHVYYNKYHHHYYYCYSCISFSHFTSLILFFYPHSSLSPPPAPPPSILFSSFPPLIALSLYYINLFLLNW